MFCTNCGKESPVGAKFCPQCGAAVSSETQYLDKRDSSPNATAHVSANHNNSISFSVYQKIEIGYITFAVVFVLASIICLASEGFSGFLTSLVILIIGSIIACALIFPAAKAARELPNAKSEKISKLAKKWKRPLQVLPIIYIASMIIRWIALI